MRTGTPVRGRVCFTQSANQLPTSGSSIRNAIYRRSTRSSNLYAAPKRANATCGKQLAGRSDERVQQGALSDTGEADDADLEWTGLLVVRRWWRTTKRLGKLRYCQLPRATYSTFLHGRRARRVHWFTSCALRTYMFELLTEPRLGADPHREPSTVSRSPRKLPPAGTVHRPPD